MSPSSSAPPRWVTSSLSMPAEITALECASLSDHLAHCGASRGPWQLLGGRIAHLHAALSGHVITSTLTLAVLLGSAWLWL
jgi:hypothetical protein